MQDRDLSDSTEVARERWERWHKGEGFCLERAGERLRLVAAVKGENGAVIEELMVECNTVADLPLAPILTALSSPPQLYVPQEATARDLRARLATLTLHSPDLPAPVQADEVFVFRETTPPWRLPAPKRTRRQRQPDAPMPQAAFQEIRNPAIALADGPLRLGWQESPGEVALVHEIPGDPLQTKFTDAVLPWWGLPAESASLWHVLQDAGGIPAVLLLYETIGRLLELPDGGGRVTAWTDELAEAIGLLRRRTPALRKHARARVYRILRALAALRVHGCRNGRYRDPRTGELLDLHSRDPLLIITGERVWGQAALDNSAIPDEVSFACGEWLERFHGNRQVLTDVGDFRRLAAIPSGKAVGALAQRIGLALQQRWREQASHAQIGHVGEDPKRPTLRLAHPFTRRGLCELFRGEPDLAGLLKSGDPHRARKYWRDAIALLGRKRRPDDSEHAGLIGHYKELDPMPHTGRGVTGWQDWWYSEQRLDIRPCRETTEALAQVNTAAQKARAARARKRRKGAG